MNNCIFCKIIKKEIPAKVVFEDEEILVFHDIHPKADIHWLAIPKLHIDSMLQINYSHEKLMGSVLVKLNKLAVEYNIEDYKLLVNTGLKGGQEVFHIHFHLLANN